MTNSSIGSNPVEDIQNLQLKDTVLIVEDNPDLLSFMTSLIETKYVVISATNGSEAIEKAIQHMPNLILSDLMMPVMDGIELTTRIKEDERTSHIPVILLTAKSDQQTKLTGLRTGADDYVTKPFSNEELIIRIENLIEQRKRLAVLFRERILVMPSATKVQSLDEKFLMNVRNVVESHMSEVAFSVEQLADEVHLNRTQLLRKLKALTGLSPNDFIKDLRLKKAADLIRQKADTVTQIGYAVGFNDQSYFTKCFKKQFGITPTEYGQQLT